VVGSGTEGEDLCGGDIVCRGRSHHRCYCVVSEVLITHIIRCLPAVNHDDLLNADSVKCS